MNDTEGRYDWRYARLAWEFYRDLKNIDAKDLTKAEQNFIKNMDKIKSEEN